MLSSRHRGFPLVAGVVSFVVYLAIALLFLDPQAIWSPDEGAKLLQLQNLRIEDGRLTCLIPYLGKDLDPALEFAPIHPSPQHAVVRRQGDDLAVFRLPFFPLLSAPFYRLLGNLGLYLLPALAGAVAVTSGLLLIERGDRRLLMWIIVAFASPFAVYATIFWEHTIATALGLTAAVLLLSRVDDPSPRVTPWVVAGALMGVGAYLRPELLLFSAALLAACWFVFVGRRKGPLWAGVSMAVVLAPYVPLHQLAFGQLGPDHASVLFYPLHYLVGTGWRALPELLVGPAVELGVEGGWRSVAWSAAAVLAVVLSLLRNESKLRVWWLAAAGFTAVPAASILFDPSPYRSAHGLLLTTPWALLGICRAREVWQGGDHRGRIIALTTGLGLVAYTVAIIGFRQSRPHGGLEWGARYVLTFIPLLAILAVVQRRGDRPDPKTVLVTAILVCLGLGFQVRGLGTIRQDKNISDALNRALAETTSQDIVTDLWWLHANAAPMRLNKAFFLAESAAEVAEWVEIAADHERLRFTLVTLDGELPAEVNRALRTRRITPFVVQEIEALRVYEIVIQPAGSSVGDVLEDDAGAEHEAGR